MKREGNQHTNLSSNAFDVQNDKAKLRALNFNQNLSFLVPNTFVAPLHIIWEISRQCNLSCIHCYNDSNSEWSAPDEKIFRHLTDEIINLQPVDCCFTGGEPFLFSELLLPSANKMRRHKILTYAITNGWQITDELIPKITDSFFGIKISLDAASEQIHDKMRNKKDSFIRAVDALKKLVGKVSYLEVVFTATLINYRELSPLISLLTDIGISRLSVVSAVMEGRARLSTDLGLTDKAYHDFIESVAKARNTAFSEKIRIDIMDPIQFEKSNVLNLFNRKRNPNQHMYIAATGEVYCSPFIPISAGNIKKKSLQEIWKDGLDRFNYNLEVKKFLESL